MGGIESVWKEIWSGVPQGSVLGPLLFVVYINDLPECLSNKCKMYADDSKVFAEVNLNGQSNLQMDINSIVKWCKNWDMSLNCSKCKIMHFGSKNPSIEYFIEDGLQGIKLEETEFERDLSVIVSATGKTSSATSISFFKSQLSSWYDEENFQIFQQEFIFTSISYFHSTAFRVCFFSMEFNDHS